MAGPLTGFRILDLSERSAPAAVAGLLLADLGAELIRVESAGGDPIRQLDGSAVWLRGQRSVTIGPEQLADGSWAALRASADAIIYTVQPWSDKPAGLLDGWDAGSGQVLCLLTQQPCAVDEALADAQAGRGAPVYGELMEAEFGFQYWQQGVRPDGPTFLGFPHATYGAAWQVANGTLGALYERERTGRGQAITTSLVDGMAILANHRWQSLPDYGGQPTQPGTRIARNGNARMIVALFECSDGIWIQVHTGARGSLDRLVIAMGRPDLMLDEGAAELDPERANAIWDHLETAFKTNTSEHWREWLAEADVPCMPALPPGRSLLLEQTVANGQVEIAPDGTRSFGKVAKFARTPLAINRDVPAPGQHNAELLDTRQSPVQQPAGKQAAPAERVGPLDGLTVVDFGFYMAGPFSPRNLADLGARVIKVEELVGDPMRRPRINGFLGVQRGKEGIALNLKTEEGRRIAHELVRRADVVHHNLRLTAAKKLGIDYETLREVNPSIIYCHSSGYGNDGPWSQLPTFEPLHSALTGMLNRTGGRGNPPTHYITHMDYGCGLTSTVTVLAALLERERSGLGQHLEVPQIGAGLLAQSDVRMLGGDEVVETFGLDPEQLGHAPTNALYQTADGWLTVACGSEREWRGVEQALALPANSLASFHLARAEWLEDSPSTAAIGSALAGLTTEEARRRLAEAGVACAVPRHYWAEDAVHDPLLQRHGVVLEEQQPEAGRVLEVAHTVRFGTATRQHHRPAPALGEHTAAILHELGRSDAEVQELVAQGVVVTFATPVGVR